MTNNLFLAACGADQPDGGIWCLRLDPDTGEPAIVRQLAAFPKAGFLCLRPDGKVLYAAAKDDSQAPAPAHALNAFAITTAGGLAALNGQSLGNASFCHLSVARNGRFVMAADYGNALAAVFPANAHGALDRAVSTVRHHGATHAVANRQDKPHIHSITPIHPHHEYALVCDFSADSITVYRIDDNGRLVAPRAAPAARGDGPRHLVQHPDGDRIYVINELSNTISVWTHDSETGCLEPVQWIPTLPEADSGAASTAAEILLSPDRRFLYASNRGVDGIAWFRIDPADKSLSWQGLVSSAGRHPRHMTMDPAGRHLVVANRFSDSIAVFRPDTATGRPEQVAPPLTLPEPMGLVPWIPPP